MLQNILKNKIHSLIYFLSGNMGERFNFIWWNRLEETDAKSLKIHEEKGSDFYILHFRSI